MSVAIKYQPYSRKGVSLGGGSTFFDRLKELADAPGSELLLIEEYIPVLRGLRLASNSTEQQSVDELIEALLKYGTVRVWGEY